MRKLLLACALFAAANLPGFAQSRSNFAWWNSDVVNALHLSEQQRMEIKKIVRSYRPKLIDARAESQKAHGELEDLLGSDHFEMAQAQPIVDRVAHAQAETTAVFTQMTLEMRRVLTIGQWRELVNQWGTLQKGARPTDTQVRP